LLQKRFGVIAARIMRLLRARGMLEDRTVGDVAMLPIKDVRSMLARLYTAGVLDMRQVPKRADTAPASTIFLWHLVSRVYTGVHRNARVKPSVEHCRFSRPLAVSGAE
jgi:hypothetical protein